LTRSGTSSPIVRLVVACLALGLLLASCGDDDDGDGSSSAATERTTTTAASVCTDREALESSVAALQDVDVRAEGANGLTAAIGTVEDDLRAFGDSAGSELQPQVDAVQDSIDQLKTAVDNLDSDGVAAAVSAVSGVASSTATLVGSLEAGSCGSTTTT
jgi:hypothetical protein